MSETSDSIEEMIQQVIAEGMSRDHLDYSEATTDAPILLDSFAMVELLINLEETYGIRLNDEDVEGCRSVEDVKSLLSRVLRSREV